MFDLAYQKYKLTGTAQTINLCRTRGKLGAIRTPRRAFCQCKFIIAKLLTTDVGNHSILIRDVPILLLL